MQRRQLSLSISLTPHSRWWLEALSTIDEDVPGFAGTVLRASDHRKQVIGACLAKKVGRGCVLTERVTKEEATELLRSRHKHLLAAAYGSCPPGFRTAITRLKPLPSKPATYEELHMIFNEESMRSAARVLTHCAEIDAYTMERATRLPEPFRRPQIINGFTKSDTDELLLVLSMASILRPNASHAELREAARSLGRNRSLPKFLYSWVKNARTPPHPLPADFEFRPLTTIQELRQTAREFRNCAEMYVFNTLRGISHFYLCPMGEERALAHLIRLDARDEYVLMDVEAPKGEHLSRKADLAIECAFAKHGIVRNPVAQNGDPWWTLERVYERHRELRADDDVLIGDSAPFTDG